VIPHLQKNKAEEACDSVIKESLACWKKEDDVVDDITIIVIFLK
jgi:hypothetical protein